MITIQSPKVFCDTSYFFAALCERDVHHKDAYQLANYIKKNKIVSVATWDIVSETLTLLRYRDTYKGAIFFLDRIVPSLEVIPYDRSIRDKALEIFRLFNKEKRISYCDAISYVLITQVLDNIPSLSFDRDFNSMGLYVVFP